MPTIDTVAALLSKAERTDNAAEADAYLAKAQQLATMHAIDLGLARNHAVRRHRAASPVQRQIHVGQPRRHANTHLIALFVAIARANDVLIDIAHNNTYVIAFGLPDDVDTVEAIWLACAPRMVDDATRWVRSGAWRTDQAVYSGEFGEYVYRPATARSAKASFCEAFVARVGTRLREARTEAISTADVHAVAQGSQSGDAELVLVAKADQVRSFHSTASRARGSWRGYRGATTAGGSKSRAAGDAAGAEARLSPQQQVGTTAGRIGA